MPIDDPNDPKFFEDELTRALQKVPERRRRSSTGNGPRDEKGNTVGSTAKDLPAYSWPKSVEDTHDPPNKTLGSCQLSIGLNKLVEMDPTQRSKSPLLAHMSECQTCRVIFDQLERKKKLDAEWVG